MMFFFFSLFLLFYFFFEPDAHRASARKQLRLQRGTHARQTSS